MNSGENLLKVVHIFLKFYNKITCNSSHILLLGCIKILIPIKLSIHKYYDKVEVNVISIKSNVKAIEV